jgi:predicted glycogen debranching enzyme
MVYRRLEAERGLDPDSDLFSPGYFTARLLGGDSQVVSACVPNDQDHAVTCAPDTEQTDIAGFFDNHAASHTIPNAMQRALDQYIVKRGNRHTVIAGYPWFLDWGRDTLIVCRGLVADGKTDVARSIVQQFAGFEKEGTIPNMIHGADTGNRNTSDAPLWLYTVCADLARTENGDTLFDMDCGGRPLRIVLISMARSLMTGTPNGIHMDPESGLIFSPSHFTWMDTNHPAGTPRQGYPIEIQALWHAALVLLSQIDPRGGSAEWRHLAERVEKAILKLFYLPDDGYLSDCLHATAGISADQAMPDNALRPNQLLAITLNALSDPAIQKSVLKACERLLVPGAIRSLDDQTIEPPLEIVHNGRLINTPDAPYLGRYEGDEDSSRKPAYHNGTAWTWLFPSYCEAWFKLYGQPSRETALAWLASSTRLINSGCVGHVPEIVDGDAPHKQRGCDAQAWGGSELLRVWTYINA